jgi:hypothetical protein
MPIANQTQLSGEELLKAVGQLNSSEMDTFIRQVLALHARRQAPALPQEEAELLVKINQGPPKDRQRRYDELISRRRAETLTPEEYDELLQMTEQMEQWEVQRMEALTTLAHLRRIPLTELMDNLGIRPLANA